MHVCGMTIVEGLGLNIKNIASGAIPSLDLLSQRHWQGAP